MSSSLGIRDVQRAASEHAIAAAWIVFARPATVLALRSAIWGDRCRAHFAGPLSERPPETAAP